MAQLKKFLEEITPEIAEFGDAAKISWHDDKPSGLLMDLEYEAEYIAKGKESPYGSFHIKYLRQLWTIFTNFLLLHEKEEVFLKTYRAIPIDEESQKQWGRGTLVYTLLFLRGVDNVLADTGFARNQMEEDDPDDPESYDIYPTRKRWIELHGGLERIFQFIFPMDRISGKKLRVIKSLSIASDQNVYLTESVPRKRRWVVKWDKENTVLRERENYEKIRKLGGDGPLIKDGAWFMCGKPLLVIEHLLPLDLEDDEYEIARQLLRTQLPFIHQFAVHADLKPDNIMKRNRGSGETPVYFIIDMDLEQEEVGGNSFSFARNHYTPLYHSQIPMVAGFQPCIFVHDLWELLATTKAIFYRRMKHIKHKWWVDPPSIDIVGELKEIWNEEFPGHEVLDVFGFLANKDVKIWNNHRLQVAYRNLLYTDSTFDNISLSLMQYLSKIPLNQSPNMRVYREFLAMLSNEGWLQDREEHGFGMKGVRNKQVSCMYCGEQNRPLFMHSLTNDVVCDEYCHMNLVKNHKYTK